MDNTRRKRIIWKAAVIGTVFFIAGLFVIFLWDVFIPFLRLEIAHDAEGARELLLSKGVAGFVTVPLVEALQMVVIFIPAEFIQLSSGMAYPFWLTLILCDTGVMLGCSIIYFLVNVLRFDGSVLRKQDRILHYESLASKRKSAVLFMYLLFIMPVIPFGAICYYGSGKKVPYLRYLFTCATGVIPSIATSILMGTAIREFITNSIPLWLLLLVIVAAAAILFLLLAIVIYRNFFKVEDGSPNPALLSLCSKFLIRIMSFKTKYVINGAEKVRGLSGPFIYLANHHSWRDMAAVYSIDPSREVVCLVNEYYMRLPVVGKIIKKAGNIGKKLFYGDTSVVKMLRALRAGYPLMIFPEARLSTDGGPSPIDGKIAKFCQKMRVPVVLVEIRNNYFIAPKWRRGTLRGTCEVNVKRVISPDETGSMDEDALASAIREGLAYNEFAGERQIYKSRRKAEGLDGILYLCPHCGGLYTNTSARNTMRCSACGREYTVGMDYRFEGNGYSSIYEYYGAIKEIERKTLDSVCLDIPVNVRIFKDGVRKPSGESGVFHMDRSRITYTRDSGELIIDLPVSAIEGIPYSVGEEFEFYYMNDLYYFYPSEAPRGTCTRVALLFEMMKEDVRG